MSSQDELRQVGSGNSVVVDEPMVQDANPMQELSPQPNPEVVLGAEGGAAQERPLCQMSPLVPSETATDRGALAARSSFDMGQLMAMLAGMESRMRGDVQ